MTASTPPQDLAHGFEFLEQGRHEEAGRCFDAVLERIPSSIEARYGRLLLQSHGAVDAKVEADRTALLLWFVSQETFAYPQLLLHGGEWLMQHDHFKSAELAFAKARKLLPRHATIDLMWGECRLALGDAAAAEVTARDVLNGAPAEPQALFLLGRAALAQGRFTEAADTLLHAAKVQKMSGRLRDHLSYALFRADRVKEAGEVTGLLGKSPPTATTVTLYVAAQACAAAGDLPSAESFFLTVPWSGGFTAAYYRALGASPPKANDIDAEVMWTWWRGYADVVRKQGWFEEALAQSKAPLDSLAAVSCSDIWSNPQSRPKETPPVSLVSFSSGDRFGTFQKNLARSALDVANFDQAVLWTLETLRETEFYRGHAALLARPRGAGYWVWKPYIIYNELIRRADGEYVVYYDCGRKAGNRFTRPIDEIIAWCERSPHGILPGVMSAARPNTRWTKRDCFHLMDCDNAPFWEKPQVQATFSVWKNSAFARAFVLQWMKFAVDPRLISDHPNVCGADNYPGFIDHRHDQSVLTNLVFMHGLELPKYNSKDINGIADVLAAYRGR